MGWELIVSDLKVPNPIMADLYPVGFLARSWVFSDGVNLFRASPSDFKELPQSRQWPNSKSCPQMDCKNFDDPHGYNCSCLIYSSRPSVCSLFPVACGSCLIFRAIFFDVYPALDTRTPVEIQAVNKLVWERFRIQRKGDGNEKQ